MKQLKVSKPNNAHEREADRVAHDVMRKPASGQFFTPAPKSIQREEKKPEDDTNSKVLTEGAGVVYDQLKENPAFEAWKKRQTEMLKYKLWESQPTEYKAGLLTFAGLNLGILGSMFALDPKFRSNTISTLEDVDLMLPISTLVPYSEYFGISGFKYKLPGAAGAPYTFNTEFNMDAWFDVMRKKWNTPKISLGFGIDSAYSQAGGFKPFTGGFAKLKFGGGIINIEGYLNHQLPAIPTLVSDPSRGEPPTWIMRSLPDQLDANLPAGNAIFITVDVGGIYDLLKGRNKEKSSDFTYRKSVEVDRKENNNSSAIDHSASGKVNDVLSSGTGRPLDKDTRGFMEHRFGQDFSDVRIHTNNDAAASAQSINAKAYTTGKDIVFDTGFYQPNTETGKTLLAHELVHVVQQTGTIQRKAGSGVDAVNDAGITKQIRDKLELGNYVDASADLNGITDGEGGQQKKEWLRKHNDIRKLFLRQLPAGVIADKYSAEELALRSRPLAFAIIDCWYQAEDEKQLLYLNYLPLFDYLVQFISPYTGEPVGLAIEQLTKRIESTEYTSDYNQNPDFHIIQLLAPTIERKFKLYKQYDNLFSTVKKKFDPFTGITKKTMAFLTDTNEVDRETALKIYSQLKRLPEEQRRAFLETALFAGTLEADKDAEAYYKKNFKAQYKTLPHNWDSAIWPWNWPNWDAPFAERLTVDHVALMSSALNYEDTATRKFGFDRGVDMKPFEQNGKMTSDATRLINQLLDDANFGDPNRLVLLLAIAVRAEMTDEVIAKVLIPKSKENKVTQVNLPVIESFGFIAANNFAYQADKAVQADHDKSIVWYGMKRTVFGGKSSKLIDEQRATFDLRTLQETSAMRGSLGGMRFGTAINTNDAQYYNQWIEEQVKRPGSETLAPNLDEFKGVNRVGKVFASIRTEIRQANIYAPVLPIEGLNYFGAGSLYRSGGGVMQGLAINVSWTKEPDDPANEINLTLGIENLQLTNLQLIAPKSTLAIGSIGVQGLRFTINRQQVAHGFLGLFKGHELIAGLLGIVPVVMKLLPYAVMTMTEEFKGAKVHVYKDALAAIVPNDFFTLRSSLTFTGLEVKNMYDTMAGFLDDFSIEEKDKEGNLIRQGLAIKETPYWTADAEIDMRDRIRSIDKKINSLKAKLANNQDDLALEEMEKERRLLLNIITEKSMKYENRDLEMNRYRQVMRDMKETKQHLESEFAKAIQDNPDYDPLAFKVLETEKAALQKDIDYLDKQYLGDKKIAEGDDGGAERFEARRRVAEFEGKYKSFDVALALRGIKLKGGGYVRDLVNTSLTSLGFQSPSFEGLENINIGAVDSAFTVSGKGASARDNKPGVAIRKLNIPLIKAPSLFYKTEKMQIKADAPRLENVFVSVTIDFVANPLDRDPAKPYKYRLSSLYIEKANFNGLQLFMGSDLPLLDFPAGVPVEAWGFYLWDYDPETGNINLKIRDVKARGTYQDKNEAEKKSSQVDFGIDTTLDNDTEAGKKTAIEIRYNKEEDSVLSKLNIASALINGMDVQSPTMHVTSLPGVNAVELKNIQADVKVWMERKAGDPKGTRPMSIEINSLNIGEAMAQGINVQLFEEVEAVTDPKKKTTGRKVKEVTLPKQDQVTLKNIQVSGLKITLDDAGTQFSTIGEDASIKLGQTDLSGIKYTERSAKGSVLKALAIHTGKFNALTLEALGRNGRTYSLKEFLKFFGRTRLEGLEASASYNDGKTSATVAATGKKDIPISIDYHEPTEEGKPGYYSMRLPLSRVTLPALHIVKDDHEVIIPKPSDKAYTSYLNDVDVKLRAYVEFDAEDKVQYDIYLDSLDVADMAVFGLEYHNKKKGIDLFFEKTKPLHLPNIKAGGFRFSSTKGFGVFGKAGGWANIGGGTEMIEASFESIKAALENGEFLAAKVPGYTNSALDIDIASLGFTMDSADNMVITLGAIHGAFPTLTITQTDPKSGEVTTTKISSLTKTLGAKSVVIKLNADTSKEVDATGIEVGGLQLLSTVADKSGAKLSKTKVTLFDKKGMDVDSANVKLNADNSKEITLKGIHGGKLNLDYTSYDATGTSISEIRLPDPDHVKIDSLNIKIDDKGNKKIVVENPTLRNFSLRLPSTEKKGDYISVLCDLVVEGSIEMGDGDFSTMALGAPYDAFVLNVPSSVPVQVNNLRFEYKDTTSTPAKKDGSDELTDDQKKLLELEKARDEAHDNMMSTPAEIYGPNDSSVPNPDFDIAADAYRDAVKAYDTQKAKMITDAKAAAKASMTKKYLDAVQGSVQAKLIVYDKLLKLNIETYNGEKYVEISDDLVSKMQPLISSVVGSTVDAKFWSSEEMKKIGKSLQRWYVWGVPATGGLIDNIAEGRAFDAVLKFLNKTTIEKGILNDDKDMFGFNFNFDTSWLLDISSADEFGVPLCNKDYRHPLKPDFVNLYGIIEHYGYVSPALVSQTGQRDAANLKRISELTSKQLDDKGIKEVIALLIAYVKSELTKEAANIVKNVRRNIKGVDVNADISLMPQDVITELLKEKKKGSFTFDKGKQSIDDLHLSGVYLKGGDPQAIGSLGAGSKGEDNIRIPGGTYLSQKGDTKVSYEGLEISPLLMQYNDDVFKLMNKSMQLKGLKVGVKKK